MSESFIQNQVREAAFALAVVHRLELFVSIYQCFHDGNPARREHYVLLHLR